MGGAGHLDPRPVEEAQVEAEVVADDGEVGAGREGGQGVPEAIDRDVGGDTRAGEQDVGLIVDEQPDRDDPVLPVEAGGLQVEHDLARGPRQRQAAPAGSVDERGDHRRACGPLVRPPSIAASYSCSSSSGFASGGTGRTSM